MEHNDERGTVSAVGLAALTAVLLMGLAAASFMRGGAGIAAEYEREMQLRLAAESAVETAAARLEQSADAYGVLPPVGRTKQVDVGTVPMAEEIELHPFIETPTDPGEILDVGATAIDRRKTAIRDGEQWVRAKVVRARMVKKGNRYVWQRWY